MEDEATLREGLGIIVYSNTGSMDDAVMEVANQSFDRGLDHGYEIGYSNARAILGPVAFGLGVGVTLIGLVAYRRYSRSVKRFFREHITG